MTQLTVACVQTNVTRDPLENIAQLSPMIREAAARGPALITTPEIVGTLGPKRDLALAKSKPEETHEVLAAFRGLAARLGRVQLIGQVLAPVLARRLANRISH